MMFMKFLMCVLGCVVMISGCATTQHQLEWAGYTQTATTMTGKTQQGVSVTITTIPVAYSPLSLQVGEGAIWVVIDKTLPLENKPWFSWWTSGNLLKLDPTSYALINQTPIKLMMTKKQNSRMAWRRTLAIGEGAVWVTTGVCPGPTSYLYRIDPISSQVLTRTELGASPQVTIADGVVWVGHADPPWEDALFHTLFLPNSPFSSNVVTWLNPAQGTEGKIVFRPGATASHCYEFHPFLVQGNSLWKLVGNRGRLARFDRQSGEKKETLQLGGESTYYYSDILGFQGDIWVCEESDYWLRPWDRKEINQDGTVWRIKASTNEEAQIVAQIPITEKTDSLTSIVSLGPYLWVSAGCLKKIDPQTNRIVDELCVPDLGGSVLVASQDSLWAYKPYGNKPYSAAPKLTRIEFR